LRAVLIGGGRLADQVYMQAVDLGWPVVETYGMTETCSQVATAVLDRSKSHGERSLEVFPIWETKVDEKSRLWLKGEPLLTAYLSVDDGAVQVFDPKQDGWFLSGDVAEIDGKTLKIQGRSDRCVKVLGELVSLDEVEREWEKFLVSKGGLRNRSAVIAVDDVRLGASLVLGFEGESLDRGVLETWNVQCNPVHRIREVRELDTFPRSALGKILYGSL